MFASQVRPTRSRRGAISTARARGSSTATSAIAASGACSRKMLRQLNNCVRRPPSAGPSAAPMVPATPQIAIACASLPRMPASTGTRPASASAAPKPCTVRPMIRTSNELASPQPSDASANTDKPMPANTWPRTRRSSGSTASAPTTIAMLYAVIVHDTPTIETSKVP